MAGPNRPASRLKNRKQTTQQRKGKSPTESGNESADAANAKMEEDEAVLRPPFTTNVIGLLQAIKVLNTAPKDVRDFLANECEIIYECKICRSLFRSIANFISHKRSYCTDNYIQAYHLKKKDEDQGVVIQLDKEIKDEDESCSNEKTKSLSSIVEQLAKKKSLTLVSKDIRKTDSDISNTNEQVLKLESVNGTDSVVFQSLSLANEEDDDLMKTEIMELHMMDDDESAVIGTDGSCLGFRNDSKVDEQTSETNSDNNCLICTHCGHKFSTRKTLKFHVLSKHNESRLVFSCTDCSEMFVNPWGVYRHLFKVHRRTMQEIRKLRETIQQNSHRVDQPPANKKHRSTDQQTATTTTVKLTEQQRLDEENKAWMDNLESDNDFQCCGGCGRRFERKAALHSHSLMCQKRIAARNTFASTKGKQKVDKIDEKLNKQSKGSNKRKPIKKKNQSPEKDENVTSDISQPPSEVGQPSSSRRGSIDVASLPLHLSDEDSLQEIPLKDPLEVSDFEEMPTLVRENIIKPIIENIPVKEIICENISPNSIVHEKSNSESKHQTTPSENSHLLKSPVKEVTSSINTEQKLKVINDMLSTRIKAFTSVGKKFVCMPCDYRYSSLASLRRHMAVHFNWKRFRCLRCDFMSFDKREIIVHAQTVHQATLANIKKFITRMLESESDSHSSKVFLPLNTTPQEIITLDDSDDDSTKHLVEGALSKDDCDDKDDDLSQINSNNSNNSNDNELSRKLIVEMILGGSETQQQLSLFTKEETTQPVMPEICTPIELSANSSDNSNSPTKDDSSSKNGNNQTNNLPILSSRPVRNRVKPVNKDFIYDMSSLTKDDSCKDYGFTKSTKRKSDFFDSGKEIEKPHHSKTDTHFEISTKKKRRRNSKVFLVNSNSNSNSNEVIMDNVKIVPILCSSTNESICKIDKKNYEKETESDNSDYSDCKNTMLSSDTDTSPVKSDISDDSLIIIQSTVST